MHIYDKMGESKSSPINIPPTKVERTLSETFDLLSPKSRESILGMTGGARPTSTVKNTSPGSYERNRRRVDSCDFSPITRTLLDFHGIKSVNKIDSENYFKEKNTNNV